MANGSGFSSSVQLAVSALAGGAFGFALERGQVYRPERIVQQLRLFEDNTMLKMFLAAAATSAAVHAAAAAGVLGARGSAAFSSARERTAKTPKGIAVTVVGTALLGAGMALCGACPGTVLAQVGTATPSSLLVLVGGLAGAVAYALADSSGVPQRFYAVARPHPNVERVDVALGQPFASVALALAGALAGCVLLVELLSPYVPTAHSWPPYYAGVVVGAMQLPMLLVVDRAIGSSSSYVVAAAHALRRVAPRFVDGNAYLARSAKTDVATLWQPVYLCGAVAGAALSAASGAGAAAFGVAAPPPHTVSAARALAGGFLLIFGARLASGCTSGHGISRMSQLSLTAMCATAAMFGGGIVTATVLDL